jgi:membrane protease YdiL (CAAX protease family)
MATEPLFAVFANYRYRFLVQWKRLMPALIFLVLLAAFWGEVLRRNLQSQIGGHVLSAFICFGLLLAGEWFFGFGIGEWLARRLSGDSLRARLIRVLTPILFVLPYLVFAIPRHTFEFRYLLGMALFPVICASTIEFSSRAQKLLWQDIVVLPALALTLELRVFSGAWPYNGLGSLPKIYLADVALYVYLVVRRIEGMGYSLVPRLDAFVIGLREWVFFLPIALGLGFALHFISFFPRHPSIGHIALALVVVFFLTAVPEEIFFRGILQNLLEGRYGRRTALLMTSALFGLSHFHKGATFNWRYVILAAIAGIFYGRSWRARRRLPASSTAHTLVDVVWGLWFR